jgi:di/tricarboxylate transporter
MTPQAVFTIILLVVTLLVMASQRLRADLIALLVMLLLIISGILSPAEAFGAFGQPVIIIVASIYVLGAALFETGVAIIVADQIMRFGARGERVLMLVIMIIAGILTSVLGGLLVVALLMPAVLRVSRQVKIAPSRLLLPLATAATIGSQLTLLGTPSNVVVSDILAVSGYEPLGLFTLTPYALVSVGLMMLWFLLPGRWLLRRELPQEPQRPSLEEVERSYQMGNLLYRLRIRSMSDLIAKSLAESQLGPAFRLNVVAVQPEQGKLRPATSEWVLEQNDQLIVEGDYGHVLQAAGIHSLELKGSAHLSEFNRLEQETLRLAEVMVPFRSSLVGKSLAAIDFRGRYGLNVLAVHRQGKAIRAKLSDLVLAAGDSLLVQGPLVRIRAVGEDLNLVPVTDLGPQPGDLVTGKAGLTLAILGAMLVLVVSGLLSLVTASVAAVVALILTNCLSVERAYQSINGSLLVLIGGMLPLSIALEKTGAAEVIAQLIVDMSHNIGALGSLLLIYLITSVITQVIANSVAAALLTPIAINLAVGQGLSPQPFAIAIAFGVMAAYITPLTDGDNLFVREAGRYTMRDFVANGLPIFMLQTAALMLMINFYYGLL